MQTIDENKVLACSVRVLDFMKIAGQYLKPHHFESSVRQNIAKIILDFWTKYKTTISTDAYGNHIKILLQKKIISENELPLYINEYSQYFSIDVTDNKYVLDNLLNFIKTQEIKKLIERTINKHLPNNDFTTFEHEARKITEISTLQQIEPTAYLSTEAIELRTTRRNEIRDLLVRGIPTGIPKLDNLMNYRGWCKDELYLIMGKAKAGKTMAVSWFANSALLHGYNVAYFSLETSEEVLTDRLDAMNAEIEINHLGTYSAEVVQRLAEKKIAGQLYIFDYPTKTCSGDDVELQLEKLDSRGIRIDMLVVDYSDLMKPTRRYESKWDEQAGNVEDLRRIAKVRGLPVLTPTQVNRAGSKKQLVEGSDVSGAWEKIAIADGTLSIGGTKTDMDKGEVLIHLSEFRTVPSKTLRIKTAYNFGRFYSETVCEVA